MNQIDQLLSEFCPSGVKFATLGELGAIFGGLTGKSKADFSNGNARFISYVNIYNNMSADTTVDNHVKLREGEQQRTLKRGDILFTGSSETASDVGMSSVVTVEPREPIYLNSFSIGFRFNDASLYDPEFMKHLFRSVEMRKQIVKTASGVTRFNVSKNRLKAVRVPLPPLEIQKQISTILDRFMKLEAELEARRRQFGHYRDTLLSFDAQEGGHARTHTTRLLTLGEVCKPTSNIIWSDASGEYQYIDLSSVNRDNQSIADVSRINSGNAPSRAQKLVEEGDVLFATTRPTLQRYTMIDRAFAGQIASTGYCVLRADRDAVLPQWIYYIVSSSSFLEYVERHQEGSAYPAISDAKLREFTLPVPPLEEQRRVVTILEKFDALVNDLSSGLPAEIAARRQQYAYYRDQLLTFKEAA